MLNRYDLYELAVQAPDLQARFLRALHRGTPLVLREDFSGPAAIARAWVALDERHRAVAVDRDPEPLAHARARLAGGSPALNDRVELLLMDALECRAGADVIAAFNFALCELHDRASLLDYLRGARASLNPGGVLACDLYAGADALTPGSSKATIPTPAGPLGYTWEQRRADPVTARVENAMHFKPAGQPALRDAFVYHWRLWSIPELRDAMIDAGFGATEVHLSYGDALDGDGSPIPAAHQPGEEAGSGFVAYIIARLS